jgi:hypothetical protein
MALVSTGHCVDGFIYAVEKQVIFAGFAPLYIDQRGTYQRDDP